MRNISIDTVKSSATTQFRQHRFLVLCIVALLVMAIAGNILKSGVRAELAEQERQLSSVRNDINAEDTKSQKSVDVVKDLDHGLSTKRWKNDDDLMTEWISPAFTWSSLSEYQTNRQFYVERLGETHPFLTGFLVEKESVYNYQNNYNSTVSSTDDINMHINSFKSYIVAIDELTDVYSYLAMVTVASYDSNGNEGSSHTTIVLLYDITPGGEVQNFRYTMTSE